MQSYTLYIACISYNAYACFTQYYCHTPLSFWCITCPAPRLPSGGQRSETPKRSTTGWSCRRQGGTLRAIPHISKDHDDDGEEEDEEMIMLVIRVAMAMRKHAQPWYCELLLLPVWYALSTKISSWRCLVSIPYRTFAPHHHECHPTSKQTNVFGALSSSHFIAALVLVQGFWMT